MRDYKLTSSSSSSRYPLPIGVAHNRTSLPLGQPQRLSHYQRRISAHSIPIRTWGLLVEVQDLLNATSTSTTFVKNEDQSEDGEDGTDRYYYCRDVCGFLGGDW